MSNENASYPIGTKTWVNGTEITITTEPYTFCGGELQDGVAKDGKVFTMATPASKAADLERNKAEWKSQQDGFRRLREAN